MKLTEEDLILLLDAYGADAAYWPVELQPAFRAAMAQPGAELAAALAHAGELDELLGELPAPQMPAGLRNTILAAAPVPAAPRPTRWFDELLAVFTLRPMAGAGAAFASLALGLVIGTGTSAAQVDTLETDAAVYSALGLDSFALTDDEATQ